MKKIIVIMSLISMMLLSSCGGTVQNQQNSSEQITATEEPKKVLDLRGEWMQVDDDGNGHIATVSDDTIEIYWYNKEDETKSLYWAGSYTPPTEDCKKYEWESVNDKEKTGSALLASPAETKKFTYEKEQIIYEASAFGTTKTVRLERKK